MAVPPDLEFDPGSPPKQWLETPDLEARVTALGLWEMTVGLIHNEEVLSADPRRFLAMVHEHKVSPPYTDLPDGQEMIGATWLDPLRSYQRTKRHETPPHRSDGIPPREACGCRETFPFLSPEWLQVA